MFFNNKLILLLKLNLNEYICRYLILIKVYNKIVCICDLILIFDFKLNLCCYFFLNDFNCNMVII